MTTPTPSAELMRDAFEAWCKSENIGSALYRNPDGSYKQKWFEDQWRDFKDKSVFIEAAISTRATTAATPPVGGEVVVPDGYVLVPIEPNDDMEYATFHGGGHCNSSWCSCNSKDIYRSMVQQAITKIEGE